MNSHELLKHFPNASDAVLALNVQNSRENSKLERRQKNVVAPATPAHKGDTASFLVCVCSVRNRLLDEDNICEKEIVDCCRYAGFIPDDNPEKTHIQTTQRKAAKGEQEHTEITIYSI